MLFAAGSSYKYDIYAVYGDPNKDTSYSSAYWLLLDDCPDRTIDYIEQVETCAVQCCLACVCKACWSGCDHCINMHT
jgi:hypothetical protein